jgi:RNA polymerase sigma factor (sigma-70 family)
MIGYPGGHHGCELERVPASRRGLAPKSSVTDEQLMAAYVAGDAGAFRELFGRYTPQLRALFRDARGQEALDLVQQTFLHLHRARGQYRPALPFRPWLMTIARNLKREQLRRLRRTPSTAALPAEMVNPGASSAETTLELRRALSALDHLPKAEREVIALRSACGLTVAETARQVGSTEAAVKARAHRGYRRLREAV